MLDQAGALGCWASTLSLTMWQLVDQAALDRKQHELELAKMQELVQKCKHQATPNLYTPYPYTLKWRTSGHPSHRAEKQPLISIGIEM